MKAGEESIVTQVERFEEYCLRERSLEGDIELALARRVDAAVEAVELAEHELENATRERAEIEARVERARQLEFDRAKEFRSPVDSRLQAFSNDVPDPHQGAAGTGVGQEAKLNASSHPKDDLSDEFITLLVQRYTDICHERQMLQEEIEDFLVRKERTAAEKLRHARIACEATRQKAVEIVAALNEASQGDSRVNLPTRCISPVGSLSDFPDANGVHPSASGPIAIPPLPLVTGPDPVQAGERSTPIDAPNQAPSQASYAPTGNHSLDGSRSPVPIHLATGSSNNPPATVPSFSSPTITPTQQEIYKKYDLMMIAAKASGQGVSMLKIPWPILMPHAHHYPMQNVMVNHLEDLIVINFFQGYFQWKGWNYVVEGVSILTDWGHIFSQIPDHKRGGRQCAEKVFLILRDLLQI